MSTQDGGLVGPRLETGLGIYSNQPATGLPYRMGLEKSHGTRRRGRGGVREGREVGLAFRRRPEVILKVVVSLQLGLMAGSISSFFHLHINASCTTLPPVATAAGRPSYHTCLSTVIARRSARNNF